MNWKQILVVGAVLNTAVGMTVHAQEYPSRPISIVVPFPAGGPVDATTRLVTEKMKERVGQPFVVENVGGAAGSIAAGKVARARPDGYTLLTGIWGTQVANAAIYKLSYDVEADFEPIALISSNPLLIVARGDFPAVDLKGLIAWLKANPGKASQGTSGVGSVGHVAGLLFQKETGTNFQFVPYKGLAPAMQDLMAGTVDLMFDTPATSLPHLKSGRIKAFAVTSTQRLSAAPTIPTVGDEGFPSLQASTWTGFFAPKGTPRDVIDRLSSAATEALSDPTLNAKLIEIGQEVYPAGRRSARALRELQAADMKKWLPIIKAANLDTASK